MRASQLVASMSLDIAARIIWLLVIEGLILQEATYERQ